MRLISRPTSIRRERAAHQLRGDEVVLGRLEISEIVKGTVYFKSDQREHKLCYMEGDPLDQAIAFEVGSRAVLSAAASAPAGTPAPVIAKLADAVHKAVHATDTIEALRKQAMRRSM